MSKKEIAGEISTLIEFGQEMNVDLHTFMKMEQPVLYINSMCDLLGYGFQLDKDTDTTDPVYMDMILHHVYMRIIVRRIAYCHLLYVNSGTLPDKKGRGAKFCELVVGTIDDRDSWHDVTDLYYQTYIEVDSVSNFERYDEHAPERGRICRKKVKRYEDGTKRPYPIDYVYRDPSKQYKTQK